VVRAPPRQVELLAREGGGSSRDPLPIESKADA